MSQIEEITFKCESIPLHYPHPATLFRKLRCYDTSEWSIDFKLGKMCGSIVQNSIHHLLQFKANNLNPKDRGKSQIMLQLFDLQILFTHCDGLTLSKPNFRAANKQGTGTDFCTCWQPCLIQ